MPKVKDRPILFNTEMVVAILAGRKTQTRRIIKPQPVLYLPQAQVGQYMEPDWFSVSHETDYNSDTQGFIRCPYGKPGDQLWVRESWRVYSWHESEPIEIETKTQGGSYTDSSTGDEPNYEEWYERMVTQSSNDMFKSGLIYDDENIEISYDELPTRWRPSIHMPRWCSRINLEVINTRVERVQDISREDAMSEGVDLSGELFPTMNTGDKAKKRFPFLWDSINVDRDAGAYSWYKNPWVWVVEFKQIEKGQ